MKKTLIAAGALAVAIIAPLSAAQAKDAFSLTIGGPNGFVHIGSPGPKHPKHPKGPGYGGKHFGYGGPGYGPYNGRYGYDLHGARAYGQCLYPRQIRRKLRRHGWHGMHALEIRPNAFKVRARRPNGMLFKLKVDRCTGHVIRAKPLFAGYGPGYGAGYGYKGYGRYPGWRWQ